MNLDIRPYISVDGIPTFRDSDIALLYQRMCVDGTLETMFYDGHVITEQDFIMFMKSGIWLFFIFSDGELAGFCWIDRIENRMARFHWCVFSPFWGNGTHETSRKIASMLLDCRDLHGEYMFDVFVGIVPESNVFGVEYTKKIGCKMVGIIPHACYNAGKKKSEPGVVFYFTREEGDHEGLYETGN